MKSFPILVVEDNPADVRLIGGWLEEATWFKAVITYAETLSDCNALLKEHLYEAIMLDLNLPDSKGIETFRWLKALAPEVPVVVLQEFMIRALR